jgi:enamine deaminase RidA (YjgF/YER057c/UK114 family)
MAIERLHRGPRMSRAVVHGETIYTNAPLASDPSADIAGKTRDILAQLEALLAEARQR